MIGENKTLNSYGKRERSLKKRQLLTNKNLMTKARKNFVKTQKLCIDYFAFWSGNLDTNSTRQKKTGSNGNANLEMNTLH